MPVRQRPVTVIKSGSHLLTFACFQVRRDPALAADSKVRLDPLLSVERPKPPLDLAL